MPKVIGEQTSFVAGISFADKEGPQGSYDFGVAIDHRTDPKSVTVNPKATKDSGSVVTDLPLWGSRACSRTFVMGNTGNIYQKENGTWSLAHSASNSSGNGMAYFPSDGALYYAQNDTFGRMLDACTESSFYDDFLGSEGGEPTNTKSLNLERSSSQYAYDADNSNTSITSDLTIEAYCKFESLPVDDESMVILSKWNEQSDERSYKLDVVPSSDFFGDGRDGALTISSNTTEDPIDANCSGTSGQYTLSITNSHASFGSIANGDKVLIHQSRGTNAGTYQLADVVGYSGGVLTLDRPLTFSPAHSATASVANKAQVRILRQHTTVTVNSGITYTCKAWDGLKGGLIGWYANDTTTINGSVVATKKGFRGGQGVSYQGVNSGTYYAYCGEGTGGASVKTDQPNGNGGGAANTVGAPGITTTAGGGGGGNGTAGDNGTLTTLVTLPTAHGGYGGQVAGSTNLTTMVFGGGGGGATQNVTTLNQTIGGYGGGIVLPFSADFVMGANGSIYSNGGQSDPAAQDAYMFEASGSGAGGSILIKCQTATLGDPCQIAAYGGAKSPAAPSHQQFGAGGKGGDGRVHIDYLTSFTGTACPSLSSAQDSSLGSGDGYLLRLHLSSSGANSETLVQNITDYIDTSSWNRWQVSWEDTTSTARFYRNGDLLGVKEGSFTSIYNSTAALAVGADFNDSGTAQNFYDGLMDDVRLWNDVRTASELLNKNDQVLFGTEANLIAYYEFTDNLNDSQSNVSENNMTGVNTPTYSTDVPFSGITTRNDFDQGLTSGSFTQSYAPGTSIDEGATHRQSFTPAKDPQKSIILDIDDKGTGDWTITVHDRLNRTVAEKTIANSDMPDSGYYEIFWDEVWRPIVGAEYHFHVTSTVADGTLDTTDASDLETAYFTTQYQFLVSDVYHPMEQMLDFMVIGNERYLAKFEAGDIFDPHRLTFPAGYRVRSLARWREFIAIGCWKGESITDYDQGEIFFWDGISDSYNHSITVPEGGINAMFGTQDVLFIVAGYTGEILIYTGGGAAQKFHKLPKLARDKYIEIAPGAINMWRTNIHFGAALNTDSEVVHKGVYSIGSAQRNYAVSLGFDYPTSLGDQVSSSVRVGMVFPSGKDLYVGWQNSNAFGIDKISTTNDPYDFATLEMLITDMGSISDDDCPMILRADFEPLKTGESMRVKYKADRESSWKVSEYEDTVGAKEVRLRIPERMKEIQTAVDWLSTGSTQAKLLGVSLEVEKEHSTNRKP